MVELSQAPLIEVIFELRWGEVQTSTDGTTPTKSFMFSDEDASLFQGQFRSRALAGGYGVAERQNEPPAGQVPHVILYRYRKKAAAWPCLQTGLGIFTVNQVNEGYKWTEFKEAVEQGLRLLDEGHPNQIKGLTNPIVRLHYQDGFVFDEDETPEVFLENKMELELKLPSAFLDHEFLDKKLHQNKIWFSLKTSKPEGHLMVDLITARINGMPGYVMNTVVQSPLQPQSQDDSVPMLLEWLEHAHALQRHTFHNLIDPTFRGNLK